MPTPKDGYRAADGEKVPSVTTITGRFKDSGGLLFWAFNQGKSGATSLYAERQVAADIGTLAHDLVEAHIKGLPLPEAPADMPESDHQQAGAAFGSYLTWERHTRLRIIHTEVQLVSERHRYGGTLDAIGIIDNELCLLDWKTSNATYSDYLIQIAAYGALWEENYPDTPLIGGFHLLRFAKEHGDFSHHHFPRLDDGFRAFVLMRELYDLDKQLKRRAA